MDWAYESTPATAINSGAVGITEVIDLPVRVYSNEKNIYVNSAKTGGMVSVYNNVGQLVKSVTIDNEKMTINMNDVAAGIYNVNVVMGEKVFNKKVSL